MPRSPAPAARRRRRLAPGQIGTPTVRAGLDSQGGYTLTTVGPVVVDDLHGEKRFTPPASC